jgi:micrococcal nuclease
MNHQQLVCRLVLSLVLLTAVLTSTEAHRSGCHRWHSCPSDRGTYTCGDLGYCSQCPDNTYCQAGQPRSAARQPPTSVTPPPPSPVTPPPAASPSLTQPLTGRVTQIVDGDTIDVELQGRRERVRYIGIDTPETKHPSRGVDPYGPEAAEANRRLVGERIVRLEFDVQPRDQYGRLLAYVYVGEVMVNAELVRQGYALLSTYPPNVKHEALFVRLQREAREAKRGLWGP